MDNALESCVKKKRKVVHAICFNMVSVINVGKNAGKDVQCVNGFKNSYNTQEKGKVIHMNPHDIKRNHGLKDIIRKGKKQFRIPENTDYYSDRYYKLAEKKYIKLCVIGGRC